MHQGLCSWAYAPTSLSNLLLIPLMTQSRNRSTIFTVCMDHSMSTSKDTFSTTSSFLEISASSLLQALRSSRDTTNTKHLSCQGCTTQPCLSLTLGQQNLLSLLSVRAPYLVFTLPSTPACLCSKAKLLHTQGLGHCIPGFPMIYLSLALEGAEGLQATCAPLYSGWCTDKRNWRPAYHCRALTLME